jgi:hypothetical protein
LTKDENCWAFAQSLLKLKEAQDVNVALSYCCKKKGETAIFATLVEYNGQHLKF